MAKYDDPVFRVRPEDFPMHLIYFDEDDNALDDVLLPFLPPGHVNDKMRVVVPFGVKSVRVDTHSGREMVFTAPPEPTPMVHGRARLIYILTGVFWTLALVQMVGLAHFPRPLWLLGYAQLGLALYLNARSTLESRAYYRWYGVPSLRQMNKLAKRWKGSD